MSTLVRQLGNPTASSSLPKHDYAKAISERRVVSIHSSDEPDGADFGQVGHHVSNVLARIVFRLPIPDHVIHVIGFNKREYYG